jgi:hypothetical protein
MPTIIPQRERPQKRAITNEHRTLGHVSSVVMMKRTIACQVAMPPPITYRSEKIIANNISVFRLAGFGGESRGILRHRAILGANKMRFGVIMGVHMIITDLTTRKHGELIHCECEWCAEQFKITKHRYNKLTRLGKNTGRFCSSKCVIEYQLREREWFTCPQCEKKFTAAKGQIKWAKIRKNRNGPFCSRGCCTRFYNARKTFGFPRSKLEKWLEIELLSLYPKLDFLFNDRTTIKSELDIYIPSVRLAFELNGPIHYEPIFGAEKLKQVRNNDKRKFQACLEHGIELAIIDSSGLKYFKVENAKKYLDLIRNILDMKLIENRTVDGRIY